MKNKILILLIVIITIFGLILSLMQLYAPVGEIPLVIEGSYYYLGTTFILFIIALLIQNPINKTFKTTTTIVLTLFSIIGFNLTLITLYASPLHYPEPHAAAIFFLAGMLGGSIIPIIKIERNQEKINIGKIHKIIRIILLIIIIFIFINVFFNIMNLLLTQ